MSNFALDVNSSQGDIVSSLNYALSNLGTASAYSSGNVLTANVQTGAITTGGNTVAYLYQYMNVAYGNSATGSGFTSNSYYTTYYGIHNNTANVADTNPADYQWTQVSGGFGTTKQLYYQTLGGRQINFDVNTVAPKYFSPVQDNTPINLDIVTGTTGANGTSGISTYYYPVYTTSNAQPYTPYGGSYNFGTSIGIPPLDPLYQLPKPSTFAITVPTGWTSYSNVVNGYTYYTIFSNSAVTNSGTGNVYISGNAAVVDIFTVGSGQGGAPVAFSGVIDLAQGGGGGQVSYVSNVTLQPSAYQITVNSPTWPTNGGNVSVSYLSNSSVIISSHGGFNANNKSDSGGYGNYNINANIGRDGGTGSPEPWSTVTWVGQPAANGVAFFGGGSGGSQTSTFMLTGNAGLGGGGTSGPYGTPSSNNYGLPGSGGGGGGFYDLDGYGATGGSGVVIIRKHPDQTLYTPSVWSNIQPTTGNINNNIVVWVSSALATSNTATGNVTSLSWGTPAQLSGNVGANGVPGGSNYSFPVYTWANISPATPQANTGSWNFTTGTGTPPDDPSSPALQPTITPTYNSGGFTNVFVTSNSITNTSTLTNYFTFYNNAIPGTTDYYLGYFNDTFTVTNGPITANLFLLGGGADGQYPPAVGRGGDAGNAIFQTYSLTNGTYYVRGGVISQIPYNPGPNNDGNSTRYSPTAITNSNVFLNFNTVSNISGNTFQLVANSAAVPTVYTTQGGNGASLTTNITTIPGAQGTTGNATIGGNGGGGIAFPFFSGNLGTGQIAANGVAFYGAGGGSPSSSSPNGEGIGGFGGGGNSVSHTTFSTFGTWGSGSGGGADGTAGGQGLAILTTTISTVYSTWSTTIPESPGYGILFVSYATAQIQGNTGIAGNLTWSAPQQLGGQRGVFTSAYVVTNSDPTFYSTEQYSTAFASPRTATTPPIGTGYVPITGDTAAFTYTPTNTVVTKTFNANINQWLSANTQVISGNLFVSNSITASALITTDVYPLNIISQNATIGNIQSPGFWMQASTGNARFGGNISIGNNLIVGNNALFGNNMIIGNSLAVGNNASISNNLTVGNNTVIGNSLDIGNNAIVGNAMAIGNYLTVGTNASIGNNLFIGNNAIIGNSASIGANLIVGQSASIGNNLIVGNNAVIGGNLTILGLVSGGNLSANVVNTTNIAYNAITASQMAPLSIASTALQSASLLSRMFTANSVPANALSPAASVQLVTVIDSGGTSISDPTLDEFYDFGPTVTLTVNPGDQILISVTGTALLVFDDNVPYVTEFTTTFKIIGTNPDSSVNDSGEQIAYWMNWADYSNGVQTNYQAVEHTFTATQAGTMTFSLQFAYGYTQNLGAVPNALEQDGATTMVALLAPYTG